MSEAGRPETQAPSPGDPRARGDLVRVLSGFALWAGPLGLGLALALLVASSGYFRSGPDVPSAGDPRAWTALWIALGLTVAGTLVGLIANLVAMALVIRAPRRPSVVEWLRLGLHAALAVLLWLVGGGR